MNLHNEIMNIQDDPEQHLFRHSHALAYKTGHRDARHAAAELSQKYDHLIEELEDHFGKGIVDLFKRKCGL